MEIARLTMDIGMIIHGAYMLQNQVRNMVKYEIASLQQIDDRLRNGIFDPDKDIADPRGVSHLLHGEKFERNYSACCPHRSGRCSSIQVGYGAKAASDQLS